MLTCVIDALELCYAVTTDIPAAFMHVDIDEVDHIKFKGIFAERLVRVNQHCTECISFLRNELLYYVPNSRKPYMAPFMMHYHFGAN
jgi:hypothetical protein